MHALPLMLGALCVLAIAYRFYSAFLGAKVLATAGTPEKRAYLQQLGVAHVMDSRSLAFADEVLELTGGAGVDVVVSSLAGDGLKKSLATLGAYGRCVELGRRDPAGDAASASAAMAPPGPRSAFRRAGRACRTSRWTSRG